MTQKQQAFVEHYAACGNATKAAELAGYAKPNVEGPKNLVKPSIQAALQVVTEKASSERIADAKERQEFWTAVMRAEAKQRFAEAELKDLKDELKRRGVEEARGERFTVTAKEQISGRLDAKAVREFLGDTYCRFETAVVSTVVRVKAANRVALAA